MKGKKGLKRPRPIEPVYYALKIESWDWDYTFKVADPKWRPDSVYDEYRHLGVIGSFTHPKDLDGHTVKITLVPSDDLLGKRAHLYKTRPDNVGRLSRDRKTKVYEGVFSMPVDVLPTVVPMLLAQHLRFLLFDGGKLSYGSALVRSYRFAHELTEDDFPPGQWYPLE